MATSLKGYIKAIHGHRPPQYVVFKGYNLSKDPVARIPDNPEVPFRKKIRYRKAAVFAGLNPNNDFGYALIVRIKY